jgi:hypothetical protein
VTLELLKGVTTPGKKNKMIAAAQAAMAAADSARRDAEWFKKQYTPSMQRNTKPTTSLE